MAASVNERLLHEAVAHSIDLSRFSNGVIRRLIGILNATDDSLMAQLVVALSQIEPNQFRIDRLESLLGSVREINASAYRAVFNALAPEMRALAGYEAGYQIDLLEHVLPAEVQARFILARISVDQVYAAAYSRPFQGALLKDWAANAEANRLTALRNSIRTGYVEGRTTDQIIRDVRGTKAKQFRDGKLDGSRRGLAAIVQTALSHTAATARDESYKANEDIIKAVRWVATLDSRTSPPCRLRDGLRYTADADHKPIGHKVPWLSGPGRLHFNALIAGTLITTSTGERPIESLSAGDLVLTHRGRWQPVEAVRSKVQKDGVIRTVNTQSGRVLRATDDHPVLTTDGWKFVGALKVGDCLLHDAEQAAPVAVLKSMVSAAPEDGPALSDQPDVALQRTLQLVAAHVDFDGGHDVGPAEVEDGAARLVLADPTVIECESARHHLFALGDALQQLGRNSLCNLLADADRNGATDHSGSHRVGMASFDFGLGNARGDFGVSGWVGEGHPLGVPRMDGAVVLGHAPGPVISTAWFDDPARGVIELRLLATRPHRDAVPLGVVGQATVGEAVPTLNNTEGQAALDMVGLNDAGEIVVRFAHDRIVSLQVQTYDGNLHDLEVKGDCSYVAGGLIVSNCRSVSSPVTKSWKELGFDLEEMSPSTRASQDGQVPADLTYGEWLRKQPAARQDEVVGAERGKLMRSGGLAFDELYSPRGDYLTLDQLRAKDAEAFRKAGL